MARPFKDGATWYPRDCGFLRDDKVRILRCEFGAKGMYLLDYILDELYEKDGYYMKWDDRKCYLVSDGAGCGCTPSFVKEFVDGCVRVSFFDKDVFDRFGVTTSQSIQRQFVRLLKNRSKFTFIEEYFLLDRTDEEDVPAFVLDKLSFKSIYHTEKNQVIRTENQVIRTENQVISSDNSTKESKVKESKEKKSKRESAPAAHPTRHRYGNYKNVLLSDEDMDKLRAEFSDYQERIERLSEYIASTGKVYKNHLATIRSWARSDQSKPQSKPETVRKNNFNRYSASYSDSDDEALVREITERRIKEREKHDQVNHS